MYYVDAKRLSPAEERDLLRRAQEGDGEAGWELVINNVPFVILKAKVASDGCYWLDVDDFISAGVLGLHDAIATFDLRRTSSFITYAKWYVFKYMMQEKDKSQLYSVVDESGKAIESFQRQQIVEDLQEAIETLPEQCQFVVQRIIAGYRQTEICEELGVHKAVLSARYRKALRLLREKLVDE